MVGLTPVLVFSVATRVQAKRVEKASQAARAYIDGVRSGAVVEEDIAMFRKPNNDLSSIAAPAPGTLNCPSANAPCVIPANLYCIDGDPITTSAPNGACTTSSNTDLVIQSFGLIPTDTTGKASDVEKGYRSYRLGVRVYRADAFAFSSSFKKGVTQSSVTGGTGLATAQAPLMEMTTQMVVGDPKTFKEMCDRATPQVTGC